ncbi:hypothetical protein D9757_000469 [Collybiopsis confluens]|uniref:F-box domain-containing protein n=1 Tax=Collybiopsis confluens TaxID=2823264 RepID=A0A8H5MGT4_9AGAR|nr:hypothetical protein D9757_000469 [Collybiopsis confluens]
MESMPSQEELLPESPFAHVFPSNYAATTSAERAQILALIEKPVARLKELNSEISRLKKVIENLAKERTTVHRYIRSHKALLSSMRRLPAEVLTEIFLHCLPADRNPVRSTREAPLLLTGVCRRWREVALHSPSLWNSIHIFIPEVSNLPKEERKRIFEMRAFGWETWLKRSGALPVSISLHVNFDDNPMSLVVPGHPLGGGGGGGGGGALGLIGGPGNTTADLEYHADFAKVLVAFCRRLKNLTLHVPTVMLQSLAAALNTEDVPVLERIKLTYRAPLEILNFMPPPTPASDRFSLSQLKLLRASSLRSVSITAHTESPYSMQLQWSNLTEVDLQSRFYRGSLKLTECIGILDKACKLQRCALTVGISSPLDFASSSSEGGTTLSLQPPDPNDIWLRRLLLDISAGKIIHLPDLVSLSINYILIPTQLAPPPLPQQLMNLFHPAEPLAAPRAEDLNYLFDHILAPRLKSLKCSVGTSSIYGSLHAGSIRLAKVPFWGFLERRAAAAVEEMMGADGNSGSGCSSFGLEKLDVCMPVTDEGLKEALSIMPGLRNLTVQEWPIGIRRAEEGAGQAAGVGNATPAEEGGGEGRAHVPLTISKNLMSALTWEKAGVESSSSSGETLTRGDEVQIMDSDLDAAISLPLCPKLETAKFTNCVSASGGSHNWNRNGSALEAAFIRFAESRAPLKSAAPSLAVTRLKSLSVTFTHFSSSFSSSRSSSADDGESDDLISYSTLRKRFSTLQNDRGLKLSWVYPGKQKVNDSPWAGLS